MSRRTVLGSGLGLAASALTGCSVSGPAVPRPAAEPSPTVRSTPAAAARTTKATGPLYGLDVPLADVATVAAVSAALGRAPAMLSRFVKLDSTFDVAALEETGAGGARVPVITLEPWPHSFRSGDVDRPGYSLRSIVAGEHDAAFRAIAEVLAGYRHRVLVRFAHEMNANWYPWASSVNGNSPGLYVKAWRHVFALVSEIAPRTEWVWAPVAAWWADQQPLRTLYPGDGFVHFVGATGYGRTASAGDTFGDWWREVREITDKPAVLAETGAAGADKVAWMRSLGEFIRDRPDIAAFVWFNTTTETTGATGDYRFDDTPAHLAGFRGLLVETDAVCG